MSWPAEGALAALDSIKALNAGISFISPLTFTKRMMGAFPAFSKQQMFGNSLGQCGRIPGCANLQRGVRPHYGSPYLRTSLHGFSQTATCE